MLQAASTVAVTTVWYRVQGDQALPVCVTPADFTVLLLESGRLWGVSSDENGVPSIIAYKVPEP
jgi:hypothetical protein